MLTEMPVMYAGGGFPWGLLIIGGILFLLWRNGVFDGRGRHGGWRDGGHGPGYGPGYGPPQFPEGPAQGQGGGPGFRGPREYFDEWHRQAHEAESQRQAQAPVAPQAPAAPPAAPASEAPAPGNGGAAL